MHPFDMRNELSRWPTIALQDAKHAPPSLPPANEPSGVRRGGCSMSSVAEPGKRSGF
jgi:hypothetical protein